jgi:RNA-directed DNA polymerase
VSLGRGKHQKSTQVELPFERGGETSPADGRDEPRTAADGPERSGMDHLMEEVVQEGNVKEALKRVRSNKGSPGIDGMTVDELPAFLAKNWMNLREQLLAGSYQPRPVKRTQIPKPEGGVRELGIPTVMDRLVQQAILQVLQPRIDPTFSEHSYGFRPGRSAHQAVKAAHGCIERGLSWVVDVDLEKFFDQVNHDVLMGRMAKRVGDKRMLRLIRRYLEAGIMVHGVVMERHEVDFPRFRGRSDYAADAATWSCNSNSIGLT